MEKNVRRLVPLKSCLMKKSVAADTDDDLLASYQKQFNCQRRRAGLSVIPRVGRKWRSRRLNGRRHPLPCSPASRVLFALLPPTVRAVTARLSTRCVKRVMSLATSIGREMNVFCEAEGRKAHRLVLNHQFCCTHDFKRLTTTPSEASLPRRRLVYL